MCNFKKRLDPLGKACERERPAVPLARSKRADDAAQPGRVHITHPGDVQDDRFGRFLAYQLLKVEERLNRERTRQLQDSRARSAVQGLDVEGRGCGCHGVSTTLAVMVLIRHE